MSNFESPTNSWIKTYIFPGGYVPTLRETIQLLPEFDFHVLHTESLRLHYAKTLDCWNDNFQQKLPEVRKLYDERFIRMWGLYLTGCASAFRTGGIDIYQCLLTKGIDNNIPMTADYMYK
jgi:cyclopropane-fatty-acyl-phospholipid synthase